MCRRRVGKRIGVRASQHAISHGKLTYEKKCSHEVNHQIDSSYQELSHEKNSARELIYEKDLLMNLFTRKILSSISYTYS
jgi:hypothetical protein